MFKIVIRNLLRNKRRSFIAFTMICAGFSLAILYYAFFLGYMNGLSKNMVESFLSHIRIEKRDYIELKPYLNLMEEDFEGVLGGNEKVEAFSKRLILYGMASTAENWKNVLILGIEPEREIRVSNWSRKVYRGSFLDENGILIDKRVAERLKVDVGSKVVVMLQDAHGNIESKSFKVKGILNVVGFENYILIDINKLQELSKLGNAYTAYFLKVRRDYPLEEVDRELEKNLPDYCSVKTWKERVPYLEKLFNLSRIFFFIYFSFIFLTAAIGILNIIYMNVADRRREIGIMRAIGMKGKRILYLILYENFVLLTIGIFSGGIISFFVFRIWQRVGLDLSVFARGMEYLGLETKLYPSMDLYGILGNILIVYILGLLAGLYPAFKASRLKVVEVLRSIR
jgi:ABC-type lipoprotein release transport system permease subunit